jgi:hypothetical protein
MEATIKPYGELEKFEKIGSLHEAYIVLQKRAIQKVKTIFDTDKILLNELIDLATNYNRIVYEKGMKIVSEKDKCDDILLEIEHCQFYLMQRSASPFSFGKIVSMPIGLVTLYLMINIGAYLNGEKDFVYICFWRSEGDDSEDPGYIKGLDEGKDEVGSLGLQGRVFYRYLPLLYSLGEDQSVTILKNLFQRPLGSFSECEMIDSETGKTTRWI